MNSPQKDMKTILEEKFRLLNEAKEIVLSTCSGRTVTSRIVSCACNDDEVLFLSWKHHTKCKQIQDNHTVALCYKNLQVEGTAEILGDPHDIKNDVYSQKFKRKQEDIFEQFSKLPGMILVKISVQRIKSWNRDNDGYCIDHIDLVKNKYERTKPEENCPWWK